MPIGKGTLLLEIEHIIVYLEYFESERRKNQLIEVMKSITRKVDGSNIPSDGDLLDTVIFGRPQIEVIEGVLPIGQLNQKQRYFLCLDFNSIE